MKIFALLLFSFIALSAGAQNIMNNGGFESYSALPWETNQLNLCIGWSNCNGNYGGNVCGSPDFLSTQGTGYAQLPNWVCGYTYPHSGNACADICSYDGGYTNYREYIGSGFTQPMVIGKKYTVSFYLTTGSGQLSEYNSNNFGVCFSTDSLNNCINVISNYTPQYNISSVIDTPGWVEYSFTYTADSAYNYITFGNFYTDAQSTLTQKTTNSFYPYAVTFIDDIAVVADTTQDTILQRVRYRDTNSAEQLILNPNPCNAFFHAAATLNQATHVQWQLVNILGQQVLSADEGNISTLNTNISIANLPQGIYWFKMVTDESTLTRQVMVTR